MTKTINKADKFALCMRSAWLAHVVKSLTSAVRRHYVAVFGGDVLRRSSGKLLAEVGNKQQPIHQRLITCSSVSDICQRLMRTRRDFEHLVAQSC